MKLVSFFSRFAVICNIAFLLLVILQKLENSAASGHARDVLAPVPFIKDLIITLGIGAVIVNFIMCIIYTIIVVTGRQNLLPRQLVLVNFLFFIIQILYFFFR